MVKGKQCIDFKSILNVIKVTIKGFNDDNITKLSASLAYATLFSLVPFLSLLISIGTWFNMDLASQLYSSLGLILGESAVNNLQGIISNASRSNATGIATIISLGVTIFGATAIFAEMQSSLNMIWGIKPKPKKGWVKYILNRLLSFSMIIVFAFLMLVTFLLTGFINGMRDHMIVLYPDITAILFQVIGFLLNAVIITFIFMLIFKMLPDAKIKFKDVTVGSVVTTLLFLLGQYAISIYLQTRDTESVYGAAAFIVILLLWIYYSSIIIYIGAEFTESWADEMGSKIYPSEYAVTTKIIEVQKENAPVESINKVEVDKTEGEQISDIEEVEEENSTNPNK